MRRNALTRSVALAWMLTIGAALTAVAPSPAAQALPDVTISVSDLALSNITWSRFSPDARFAIASDGALVYHVDLDRGVATQIPLNNPRAFDADFAYGLENSELRRVTIATGEIDTISLPPGLQHDVRSVDGATPDGRFLLVRTVGVDNDTMRVIEHHVLFDLLNDTYVTSPSTGLDPAGRSTRDTVLSLDGDRIRYRTSLNLFEFEESEYVISTGARQSISEPTASQFGEWTASPDLEWIVFGSSDEILTGIGSPIPRLYRQELATGTVTRVNLRAQIQDITEWRALPDGRVVMLVRSYPTGIADHQLFVWSNSENPAIQITRSVDGDLVDAPVQNLTSKFVVDRAGLRVAFASTATNLVEGTTDTRMRLYSIGLPPVDTSQPDPGPTPPIRITLPAAPVPVPGGPPVEVGPTPVDALGRLVTASIFDGDVTLVAEPPGNPFSFNLRTRELVELARVPRYLSPDAAFSNAGTSLFKEHIGSGLIEHFELEFPVIPDTGQPEPTEWGIVSIDGSDNTGRFVLLTAAAGDERRAYLYDTSLAAHVPWAQDGLAAIPFEPFSGVRTSGLRITGDGTAVLVTEESATPRVLRWDIATGELATLEWFLPEERRLATVSDDLGWESFYTSTDPLDIGADQSGPYRRNTRTGEIERIVVDGLIVENVEVHNGGRTLMTAGRGGDDPVNSRLFVWEGGADAPEPIGSGTVGPTGAEQVSRRHFDEATDIVTFSTFERLDTGPHDFNHSVYQRDLSSAAPTCLGRTVTVDISAGDLPTDEDDVILGTDGRDVIAAGAGNDIVCAGAGNDVVNGGAGGDIILGEAGVDAILGAGGADIIVGGEDNDLLLGGGGDDLVIGQFGTNIIAGGRGDDRLWGADGDDTIFGQDGDDVIVGADGIDNCFPGEGAGTVDCETVNP